MIKNESIVYKDETFFVLNTGKYYHSGCHGKNANPERLLHRRIWTEHNGEIPSDHHIHHINKNWRDNRIENLECISRIDHQRMHMIERFQCPEFRKESLYQLNIAQEKAKVWHASPDGIKWHSENGKNMWNNRISKEFVCKICGKQFFSKNRGKVFCCSLKCTTKLRNQKGKIKFESACRYCGKLFKHNNLIGRIKNKGCSYSCSVLIKKNNSL